MKYCLSFILLFVTINIFAQKEDALIERALYNLPDVSFKKLSKDGEMPLKYLLQVKQPNDHNNLKEGYFYQNVYLIHKGFQKPVVMETEGYGMRPGSSEIEKILDANYLNVEFRYFKTSKPDSIDFDNLSFEQAAADLHHINTLFKQIYTNKWVTTGISRGGETTTIYRYYYPNDVVASVPYVAPMPNDIEDKRIYQFLDTVGPADCRSKIFEVQKFILQNYDAAYDKFNWFVRGKGITFDGVGGTQPAFETTVLEFPFSFWQMGAKCEDIPTNNSLDDYMKYLFKVASPDFVSDADLQNNLVHYYMASTQMGYYKYDIQKYKPWLRVFTKESAPGIFLPKTAPRKKFDPSFTKKLNDWIYNKGNNIIYIYGGSDTWTAGKAITGKNVNAATFILPNADHGKARIKNMDPAMQQAFAKKLEEFTGLPVNLNALK